MKDLIEALTILLKYGNPQYPTYCCHDELLIGGIEPENVSEKDKKRLSELGFDVSDEGGFQSYRFGSC